MAKVTIHHDTPSEQMVKAAAAEEFVTDSRNRRIGVRKLRVLERLAMLKLIGSGNSENMLYISQVTPAFFVTSIDDDPVGKPATQLQLDGLLTRLDEEGLEAVTNWMASQMKEPGQPGETDQQVADLKNG